MNNFYRKNKGFSLPIVAVFFLAAILGVVWMVYGGNQDSHFSPQEPFVTDTNNEGEQTQNQENESENEEQDLPNQVLLDVAFTSQAPFGDWDDPRQQDGCEEASVLMAMLWLRGQTSISRDEALREILTASDWEQEKYGSFHDTSAQDTVERLFKDYYKHYGAYVSYDVSVDNIKKELATGHLVLVPASGQLLGNPNFSGAGPERHMLVIRGYDDRREQFITNDPGTRRGEEYKYSYNVLIDAIRDYPTGYKVPIEGVNKAIIVVER
jgi:hypothetical protein